MTRLQVQVTDEQARLLREAAVAEGRSVADLVRDAVAASLRDRQQPDREALKRRSLEVLGRFHSGSPDLATDHDRHLADALSE